MHQHDRDSNHESYDDADDTGVEGSAHRRDSTSPATPTARGIASKDAQGGGNSDGVTKRRIVGGDEEGVRVGESRVGDPALEKGVSNVCSGEGST